MAELLLELFSEEIPARMQARAADDLKRLVTEGLKAQGLGVGEAEAYATPRRLTLVVKDVPLKSPAVSEERKGPRVGAPEQALAGFLKAAGLKSIKDAEIAKDEKKGDYYVARLDKPGRAAKEIIAEVVPAVAAKFPWPKSMRWGTGRTTWVRPLHSIVCLLDGKVMPFEIEGVESGRHHARASLPRQRAVRRQGRARLRRAARDAQGDPRRQGARGADLGAGACAGQGAQAGAGRGRGAARRERRAHRVAHRADGQLRRGVPGRAGRVPDAVDEAAPEVLLAQASALGQARQQVPAGDQPAGQGRRQGDHRRQREGDPRAAVGCQVLLGAGPEEAARRDGGGAGRHHLPREAGLAEGAGGAGGRAGVPDRRRGGCQPRGCAARGAARQGRPGVGHGRRVPRAAGPDGSLLRGGRQGQARDRARHRAALQAEGADRHGAEGVRRRRGGDRRGAGRQARHAGGLLGDRREADGVGRSVSAAACGAGRDPHRAGE